MADDTEVKPAAAPEITTLESATTALEKLRTDFIKGAKEAAAGAEIITNAKKNEAVAAFQEARKYVAQGTGKTLENFQNEVKMWNEVLGTPDMRGDFVDQLRKEVVNTTMSMLDTLKTGTQDLANQVVGEDGLFGSIGKWSEGLFKNVKMPDFMKGMGINNVSDMGDAISRLAKKAYFSFMTTIGGYVPEWAKGMMESQVEGAKEMLIELAAEDGVRDAVKIMRKDRKNFAIPWDNVVWQKWRTAFDAAKKTNPNLSSRIFVRNYILNYITTKPDGTMTTLKMKDIEAPKPETPVPTTPTVAPPVTTVPPTPTPAPAPAPTA